MGCSNNQTLSVNSPDCVCPSSQVIVEKDAAGNYLSTKTCLACPKGGLVSTSDPYTCLQCPHQNMTRTQDGSCSCDSGFTQSDSTCIPTAGANAIVNVYPVSVASQVTYPEYLSTFNGATSSKSVSSATVSQLFLRVATECQSERTLTSCQALANLCVLNLYLKTSSPCALYTKLAGERRSVVNDQQSWPDTLPWLYYGSEGPGSLTSTDVSMQVSFSLIDETRGLTAQLTFVLATYSLNGTFLGMNNLTSELQFCEGKATTLKNFLRFGFSYENECLFDVSSLIPKTNEMRFYDMYLLDGKVLRPIAVRITNYLEGANKVNVNKLPVDTTNDILVRRFFMFDNMGGIIDAAQETTVLRYAESVKLTISLQKSKPGYIYPPVLQITYAERDASKVKLSAAELKNAGITNSAVVTMSTPRVSFLAEYTMDLDEFWNSALVLLILAVVFAALQWIIKMISLMRTYNSQLGARFMVEMFVHLWARTSDWFFWLMVLLTSYWWIFFKAQTVVQVLMPAKGDLERFVVILSLAFVGKTIHVLYLLWRQINMDIFFMDWETPKRKFDESSREVDIISVWRQLFVANEFNEMQTMRVINVEFTMFALLFFLNGLNLVYGATSQPDANDLTPGETNPLLRFCVTTFWWLVVAGTQIVWERLVRTKLRGNEVLEFVDFCSLANVSLFVLIDRTHGYYVHGKSVHTVADTNLEGIISQLRAEAQGMSGKRGLLEKEDVQTPIWKGSSHS
eukprot:TRINITY_DN13032_c0_g2_i5.p1 TRINITY_DN13032_c0_g2~~TRINITY_DN13032_c0_g2_i5.p1  ORF type:complete len:838 (-),score=230.14 TRINITY_DN13032_c0_g2_i5:794-3010(-)